jgi:phosphonate transport system substrate-binding protein
MHLARFALVLSAVFCVTGFMTPTVDAAELRIGITQAMYVKDSLAYDKWARYLSERTGQSVRFVYRKSYHEIQELLRRNDLDFAWICGYPYARGTDAGILRYIATPEFRGEPYYRIYLIVPASSPARSLEDLKDGIFAFSDPDSVSFRALIAGHLSPDRSVVDPNRMFRIHFFTYSHAETIKAVADRMTDGGSVDGQVWEAISIESPELARKTRVIARSGTYGLPPFVASSRANELQIASLKKALLGMDTDKEGKELLGILQLTRFAPHGDKLYDSIRLDLDIPRSKARRAWQ